MGSTALSSTRETPCAPRPSARRGSLRDSLREAVAVAVRVAVAVAVELRIRATVIILKSNGCRLLASRDGGQAVRTENVNVGLQVVGLRSDSGGAVTVDFVLALPARAISRRQSNGGRQF